MLIKLSVFVCERPRASGHASQQIDDELVCQVVSDATAGGQTRSWFVVEYFSFLAANAAHLDMPSTRNCSTRYGVFVLVIQCPEGGFDATMEPAKVNIESTV